MFHRSAVPQPPTCVPLLPCSAVPPFHRLVRCLAPLRCMFRRSAVPEHHAVPCLTPLYVPPFRRSIALCDALLHSVERSAVPPFQSIMQCLASLRCMFRRSAVPPFHRLVRCLASLRCMFRRSAVPEHHAVPCSAPVEPHLRSRSAGGDPGAAGGSRLLRSRLPLAPRGQSLPGEQRAAFQSPCAEPQHDPSSSCRRVAPTGIVFLRSLFVQWFR